MNSIIKLWITAIMIFGTFPCLENMDNLVTVSSLPTISLKVCGLYFSILKKNWKLFKSILLRFNNVNYHGKLHVFLLVGSSCTLDGPGNETVSSISITSMVNNVKLLITYTK